MKTNFLNSNGTPCIFVSTFAKYSTNQPIGKWFYIDKNFSYDDFVEQCESFHWDEDEPEFMCLDSANYPAELYHENGLPTEKEYYFLLDYAKLKNEDRKVCDIYLKYEYDGLEIGVDGILKKHQGEFSDGGMFALHLFIEKIQVFKNPQILKDYNMIPIPEIIINNIDWDGVWEDMQANYSYVIYEKHIFSTMQE